MPFIVFNLVFMLLFSTVLFAQDYEIKLDSLNAGGWFGGDDRTGHQRNVAIAQSVFIEEPITIDSFSFFFTSIFDSVNGTGGGHEVILKLHFRDSTGTILQTFSNVVTDTFTGGWITWSNINYNILTSGEYIFSAYLQGGYDSIQVHSSLGCDANAGYPNGEMYIKEVTNYTEAEAWGDWSRHPWDSNFWLKGSLITADFNDKPISTSQYFLEQNYPNPFNPTTNFGFRIPALPALSADRPAGRANVEFVSLKIYDALGREVAVVIEKALAPGEYNFPFSISHLPLSSGVYFYQMKAGNYSETKKLILMK